MINVYYRAAVGAYIVNEKGQFLVILKHNYVDKWNIVKGGIGKGETELGALKREIIEELGPIKYEIITKSKISSVVANSDIAKEDYIGQARNNYWVLVDGKEKIQVPNKEIEQIKWINIEAEEIKKYFGVHDEEGILQALLPLEWIEVQKLIKK